MATADHSPCHVARRESTRLFLCSDTEKTAPMTDKRIVGAANEHAVLLFLHRFGWLTTRMIAALQWPEATQAEAMARRTLNKLQAEKLVLRRTVDGNTVWLLSVGGARALREQCNIDAKSGQTLKVEQALHRACSNWYLIDRIRAGFEVWTEYEIQTDRAPWGRMGGKTADGLVETECGVVWVEVENAWKNRRRRHEVAEFCRNHLGFHGGRMTHLGADRYLSGLAVVGANVACLRSMLQTFNGLLEDGLLCDSHLSQVEVTYLPVSAGLTTDAGWTIQAWEDIFSTA